MILTIVISVVLASGVSYATVTMYASNTVSYDNTTSGLNSTNVQGALDEIYVAATDYTSINSRLTALENTFLDKVYPVGSIFFSTSLSTTSQVANTLGGTWEVYGPGRTLIGVGTGTDANSNSRTFAINETAGEYSHKLTIDEMPSHVHRQKLAYGGGSGANYAGPNNPRYFGSITSTLNGGDTDYTGGNAAHNIIQPYITVYMYKRTA